VTPEASVTSAARDEPSLDTSFFLSSIAVSKDTSLQPSELRLAVRAPNGAFGEVTRRGLATKVHDGTLEVRLPERYAASKDPVTDGQVACSFVIDCDVDAMSTVGAQELAEQPSAAELIAFTDSYISKKTMTRGFDVASAVAKNREGDCTEHAVFLTALARRYHRPARVVLGLAVVRLHERAPLLVGHAWSEIHDGTAWQLADAALIPTALKEIEGFQSLSYLPVQVMRREDPGYSAAMFMDVGVIQVQGAESSF
jgi:hypothetical protein